MSLFTTAESLQAHLQYQPYFDDLRRMGRGLSAAGEARFMELAQQNIGGYFGGDVAGSNPASIFQNGLNYLMRFCQNLFGWMRGEQVSFDTNPVTPSVQYAGAMQGLLHLKQALLREGGELAAIASITAGQYVPGVEAPPANIASSPYNQLKRSIPGLTPTVLQRGPSLNFEDQGVRYPVIALSEPTPPLATANPTLTPGQAIG